MIRRIPMGECSQVNALPPLYAVLFDSVKAAGEDFQEHEGPFSFTEVYRIRIMSGE